MIKLLDILNESYNPNIYQVNCKVVIGAGNRPITDIISDIRAIPGVTIVDTIESDYKTTEGRHVIELSLKIDPSPFNPFNSASYDEILSNIKKLPDVRGAQFTTNPIVTEHRLQKLIKEVLQEKEDRCKRIADKRYDKPSAYKSGAIVRCRKGNIWKDLKEDWQKTSWTGKNGQKITLTQLLNIIKDYPIIQAPIEKIKKIVIKKDSGGIESDRLSAADFKYPIIIVVDDNENYKYILDGNHRANKAIDAELKSIPAKLVNIKKLPQEFQDILTEDESLHKWFKRQGPKGKEGGWVDCNAPDGNGGYKACGRKEGEKRSKYPSCRPTPAQCKTKGKGTKWGKTK
jgi:hypothetical protein